MNVNYLQTKINCFVDDMKKLHRCTLPWPFRKFVISKKCVALTQKVCREAKEVIESLPDNIKTLEDLKAGLQDRQAQVLGLEQELKAFYLGVEDLFFKMLPQQKPSSFPTISEEVQNFLSKELKTLREEKRAGAIQDEEEHRAKRKLAKAQLGQRLGKKDRANTGATGTKILVSVTDKPVGVFKLSAEHVGWKIKLKNWVKSRFGAQLSYLKANKLAQPLAEKASYIVSRDLSFGLAPPSVQADISKRMGVFQVFVSKEKGRPLSRVVEESTVRMMQRAAEIPKYQVAKTVLEGPNSFDATQQFDAAELFELQKFMIFDYLIGNLDRHEENWLVLMDGQNLRKIKAIDNANAFPKRQPKLGSVGARNQYKWKERNFAKQEFGKIVKEFVMENLSKDKIARVLGKVKSEIDDFIEPEMEELFLKRANVIRKIVLETEHSTPFLLAEYSE